jgi:hypothetical protein
VRAACRTNALRFSEPEDMGSRNARTAVIQASKAFHGVSESQARTRELQLCCCKQVTSELDLMRRASKPSIWRFGCCLRPQTRHPSLTPTQSDHKQTTTTTTNHTLLNPQLNSKLLVPQLLKIEGAELEAKRVGLPCCRPLSTRRHAPLP